jgi:hypothetical protein
VKTQYSRNLKEKMIMLNPKKGLFPKAVNPLNFSNDQAYIASFQSSIPKHLGIAINLTWKDSDPVTIKNGQTALTTLSGAAIQLMESALFRQQYLSPIGVKDFQIRCIGSPTLGRAWNRFPNVESKWMANDMTIMVGFYDPDIEDSENAAFGHGAAMIALQECIAQSGTTDPAMHSRLRLSGADARDHDELVGTLYEDGMGVWCEPLFPLWNVLMNKFRDYLTTIPGGGLLA